MHPVRFARRRPKLATVLAVVIALAIAGAAYAAWTFTQQTSVLKAQTGNTLTLGIIAPTAGDLAAAQQCYPGGSCPLLGEVSNSSSTPITLTSYQPSSSNGFSDSNSNCLSFTGPAEGITSVPISPGIVVPAGAVNMVVSLPNALSLPSTATSSCQNITVVETSGHITLTYTAGT